MISSRNLDDLLPQVHTKATTLVNACKAAGIDLRVTCTYRDFEEQARLYSIGRTVPGLGVTAAHPMGRTVTNAPAGKSWHNWRRAFDVVPMKGGECVWNDSVLWAKVGKLAKIAGLEWAGEWKSFPEFPHMQFTEGLNLTDLNIQHPHGLG